MTGDRREGQTGHGQLAGMTMVIASGGHRDRLSTRYVQLQVTVARLDGCFLIDQLRRKAYLIV